MNTKNDGAKWSIEGVRQYIIGMRAFMAVMRDAKEQDRRDYERRLSQKYQRRVWHDEL